MRCRSCGRAPDRELSGRAQTRPAELPLLVPCCVCAPSASVSFVLSFSFNSTLPAQGPSLSGTARCCERAAPAPPPCARPPAAETPSPTAPVLAVTSRGRSPVTRRSAFSFSCVLRRRSRQITYRGQITSQTSPPPPARAAFTAARAPPPSSAPFICAQPPPVPPAPSAARAARSHPPRAPLRLLPSPQPCEAYEIETEMTQQPPTAQRSAYATAHARVSPR